MKTIKRLWCFLGRGHTWVRAYARGWDGHEALVSWCRDCGHVKRVVLHRPMPGEARSRIR